MFLTRDISFRYGRESGQPSPSRRDGSIRSKDLEIWPRPECFRHSGKPAMRHCPRTLPATRCLQRILRRGPHRLICATQGKGFFIADKETGRKPRILILFDKLSNSKQVLFNSFSTTIGDRAEMTIQLYNQNLGLAALAKAAEEKKMKPGRDFNIISYNESPINDIILNGLTTISTDFAEMGRRKTF